MSRQALFVVLLLIFAAPLLLAQSEEDLKKKVEGTVEIQKKTQQQQDDWAAEKSGLEARYRTAKANVEYLIQRKAVQEKKAQALRDAVAELDRRLIEADRLQASLQDTLNTTLNRLETWLDYDLPFLMTERKARIETVREELAQPDITGAEKLRRLLEVLQVETGYGNTVEVVQDRIELEGDTIFVDVLRLGRVSVFWRTPDGESVGEYDRATAKWVKLSGKYNRTIGAAMDMAARIRPVELIALPLGRIQP
jgi:hypothetical protein